MAFFTLDDRSLRLDTSTLGLNEKPLIEKLWTLIEAHGHDLDSAALGLYPCPDFGYFALSDRYWRGALCIYFAGFSRAFVEVGAGFLEPWLFNSRHAVELSLKGCILYVTWYEELLTKPLTNGYKAEIEKIDNDHNISGLYSKYDKKVKKLMQNWGTDILGEPLEDDGWLLSERSQKILQELSEIDPQGFNFRYPSIKSFITKFDDGKESEVPIQKLLKTSWKWDETELFTETGLPKKQGIAFTHVKVVNALHDLISELSGIQDQHDAFYAYLDEVQRCL